MPATNRCTARAKPVCVFCCTMRPKSTWYVWDPRLSVTCGFDAENAVSKVLAAASEYGFQTPLSSHNHDAASHTVQGTPR